MTSAEIQTATELRFEPPAPGSWKLDAVHFPRPVTRYWAETHPEPFRRGFGEFTRFYGMLLDTLDTAYVERLLLHDDAPRGARGGPGADPAGARRSSQGKLWREQLREWDEVVKPASIATHRELQAVDPDGSERRGARRLPDALPRAPRGDDHPAHALHGGRDDPHGDFLAHAAPGPGFRRRDLLGLLRGAAPVSAGASAELERLVAAHRAGRRRRGSCSSPTATPLGCWTNCARSTARPGPAVSAYLDLVGWRLLDGFDISGPCALELPGRAPAGDPRRRRRARTTRRRTSRS